MGKATGSFFSSTERSRGLLERSAGSKGGITAADGIGLDDLQVPLPTPVILWCCENLPQLLIAIFFLQLNAFVGVHLSRLIPRSHFTIRCKNDIIHSTQAENSE